MLHTFFYEVLEMSIASSIIVAIILFIRLVFKFFPKIFSYFLWGVLLIRLLIPFSPEISYKAIADQVQEETKNPTIEEYYVTNVEYIERDLEEIQVIEPVYPYIWITGMAVMIFYYIISYIRLRYRLIGATPYDQDEDIYFADGIRIPFVIGAMYPKIYLPSEFMEKEFGYIILHEKYHIRRKDHILKPLALMALTIHWFNPLVWVSFFLAVKDMEMSCDEAVLQRLTEEEKYDYTKALLQLATGKKLFPGLSIAFGEGDTKSRIINAIKWKKPALLTVIIAVIIAALVAMICILIPKNKSEDHPYKWIEKTDFGRLECEYVDENRLRDLEYILKELKKTDFQTYKSYTREIELVLVEDKQEVRLIYGDGITVFLLPNVTDKGILWGVEDKDLASCMKAIRSSREKNIEVENYVKPWKPSKEEVDVIREKILDGISDEDISYMTELVKVMNLELESAYFEDQFEAYEASNSKNWGKLDYDKYRLYVNGVGKRIQNDLLKRDIDEMLIYIDLMENQKDVEALRSFYYKLHDLDYYLFRYGANEIWFYVHDMSFVTTFFDSLYIYRDLRAE